MQAKQPDRVWPMITTQEFFLGAAGVLLAGLGLTLGYWARDGAESAPSWPATIAVACLAALVAASLLCLGHAWGRWRAERRETASRLHDLDQTLARANRLARADEIASRGEPVDAGTDPELYRLLAVRAGEMSLAQAASESDLGMLREQLLHDKRTLDALRTGDNEQFRKAWYRTFGDTAPDPERVSSELEALLQSRASDHRA